MKDKIEHFLLLFFATLLFGWQFALGGALFKEGAQAEYTTKDHPYKVRVKLFIKHFKRKDTWLDFLADGLGIIAGLFVRAMI